MDVQVSAGVNDSRQQIRIKRVVPAQQIACHVLDDQIWIDAGSAGT